MSSRRKTTSYCLFKYCTTEKLMRKKNLLKENQRNWNFFKLLSWNTKASKLCKTFDPRPVFNRSIGSINRHES